MTDVEPEFSTVYREFEYKLMVWGLVKLSPATLQYPATSVAVKLVTTVVDIGIVLILVLFCSPVYRSPVLGSIARALGKLKVADPPVPSAVPAVPEPANVVVTPEEVTMARILLLAVSAT